MSVKRLTIKLKQIKYAGETLGSDLTITIFVGGLSTTFQPRMKHGTTKSFDITLADRNVFLAAGVTNPTVAIIVKVVEKDKDKSFDDKGQGGTLITLDQESQVANLFFRVSGDVRGGDRRRVAAFDFKFEILFREKDKQGGGAGGGGGGGGGIPDEDTPDIPTLPEELAAGKCEVLILSEGEATKVIKIGIPRTLSAIVQKGGKPLEPINNPPVAGEGVMVHSGCFHCAKTDLTLQSLGFPFEFSRYYRSDVEHNGLMGLGWDHNFNQYVVPEKPENAEEAREFDGWFETFREGEEFESGDLTFHNGRDRKTAHQFLGAEIRELRKIHPKEKTLKEFTAVVSTYAINPGERSEIQRIAVIEGDLIWGEKIYYVRRSYDGTVQVFNCHGFIIALLDVNRNLMRFIYGDKDNPVNNYKLLETIVDSSRKPYALAYFDQIRGRPRLKSLTDPTGRQVSFKYDGRSGALKEISAPAGQHRDNITVYHYRVYA